MASSSIDLSKIEALANTLSRGLESLLAEVERRHLAERTLREEYGCVADAYETLVAEIEGIESHLGSHEDILLRTKQNVAYRDLHRNSEEQRQLPEVAEALEACQALKDMAKPAARPTTRKCPVTNHTTDQEDFEHDFTTPGVQGSLECPFAQAAQKGLPITPNSAVDPIAAEFHQDKTSVRSQDAASHNASKCPIRFLDQHSPEEVAKYFENHKHEIPRSHEICVKRYQQNEHSIRELDAKYGNLVNMIQGLGVKHKQYLPEKERADDDDDEEEGAEGEPEDDVQENISTQAVEQWAKNISQRPEDIPEVLSDDGEERIPRFEKPLREIRVGESPSRPWGISVPITHDPADSIKASSVGVKATSIGLSAETTSAPAPPKSGSARPFPRAGNFRDSGIGMRPGGGDGQHAASTKVGTSGMSSAPQIIFSGPVFFGYPPEQAAAFLQNMNLGSP